MRRIDVLDECLSVYAPFSRTGGNNRDRKNPAPPRTRAGARSVSPARGAFLFLCVLGGLNLVALALG